MEGVPLVALASHAIGAASFAVFSLLLVGRGVRGQHRLLLGACALTALWSAATAFHDWRVLGVDMAQMAWVLETLRSAAWLVFLLVLLAPAGLPAKRLLAVVALLTMTQLAAGELAPVAVVLAEGAQQQSTDPALIVAVASSLLLAVVGILLVEHLFRTTPARERWGIKFACLGIGVLFVYDFYLYSDALLFRRIQPDIWAARGLVNALCVPLLAITAARNPGWRLGLALSRKIMLRSAALVGCAVYLLAMAAGGWYLRAVGGAWGPAMQLICLFGAGLLLAGIVSSGAARARLRVFISKHFYQAHFDYRDEWRRFTQALSEGGPAPGERAIQAMAALVESPAGALWIRRDGSFHPAAHWNVPPQRSVEPDGSAFCTLLEERQWIAEAARHAAGDTDARFPAWLHGIPGLWLVVPLILHGKLFGFAALTSPRTPVALNWEVFDLLRLAGSQAASCLAHSELAERLAVARQFDSFNRMSTFVVHDLKNLLSQHSLLLANAERYKSNPEFQEDMLATLAHSVHKMTALLQRLSRGEHTAECAPNRLADVLRRATCAYETARPRPVLEIEDETLQALADGQRLERTIAHLLQNAIEATPPDGRIAVGLRRQQERAVIEVRDTGCGMSELFVRERLFRPFETTKSAGMGIGVYESREYVRELGGSLEVDSRPGLGSTFRIVLPLQATLTSVPATV